MSLTSTWRGTHTNHYFAPKYRISRSTQQMQKNENGHYIFMKNTKIFNIKKGWVTQMPTKQKLFSKNIAAFACALSMSHTFDHVILRFSIIIWTTQFVVKDFQNNVYKQLHVGYQSVPLELDGNSGHNWILGLRVDSSIFEARKSYSLIYSGWDPF